MDTMRWLLLLCVAMPLPAQILRCGDVGCLTNPMTTAGDLIRGGASGFPTRLPASTGYLHWTGSAFVYDNPTGTGTVTTFSTGNLSPLFTASVANPTSTPALTFTLSNFAPDSIFGNFTAGTTAPGTQAIPACANDGAHALVYVAHVLTCETVTVGAGTVTHTGNLTAGFAMVGNGFADSKVSTVAIDSSGNVATPGGMSTGATPPALTAGTGGAWARAAGTAPSAGCPAVGANCGYSDTAGVEYLSLINGPLLPIARVIATGTATLGTSLIASSACASVVTVTATGVTTTDRVSADFNGDPTGTVGFQPGAMLTIVKYPSSGNVNFKVCNNSAGGITPAAVTLNWSVMR